MAKKVLIVDDEPAVAEAMAQLCQSINLETEVCSEPGKVLGRVEAYTPDLVILDLFLPGTDGMKLGAQIRKAPHGAGLSLLAVSGVFKQPSTARELWANLACDFIGKPFDNQAFLTKVASRLGLPPAGETRSKRRAPRRPVAQAPTATDFSSQIARDPIYRIFLRLYEQRASGILALTRGKARRRVVFHLGQIRHASSNLAKENVGAMQVAAGSIEEEAFRKAVAHAQKKKIPLAEALVKKKVMDQRQVDRALADQVKEVATACLGWADGEVVFRVDPDGAALTPDHRIHPLKVILDGVRRFYPTDTLKAFLTTRQAAFVVRTALMDRESYTLRQAAPGESLTPQIAGTLTLGILLGQCRDEDLPLLFTLVGTGLLRLSREARDSAVPEAPPPATAPAAARAATPATARRPPSSPAMHAAGAGARPAAAIAPPIAEATAAPRTGSADFVTVAATDADLDAGQTFSPDEQAARAEISKKHQGLADANHYQVLGVSPGASEEAIAKAYLELARQWHSDRFAGKNLGAAVTKLEEIFTRIGGAKEILDDKEKRAEYDIFLDRQAKGLPTDVAAILKAEELFVQGSQLIKNGKATKALPLLEKAIELNHAEAEFHVWRGYARYLIQGEAVAEATRSEITQALVERARMPWAHYFLGRMALDEENRDEARVQFRKALALDDKHAEASQQLRLLEQRKEKSKGGLLGRLRGK